MLLVIGIVFTALLVVRGLAAFWYAGTATERRRREVFAERLLADQRLRALTHATLRAMRDEVRRSA